MSTKGILVVGSGIGILLGGIAFFPLLTAIVLGVLGLGFWFLWKVQQGFNEQSSVMLDLVKSVINSIRSRF